MWELVASAVEGGEQGPTADRCPCGLLRMTPKSSGQPGVDLFTGVFTCGLCHRPLMVSVRRYLTPSGEVTA